MSLDLYVPTTPVVGAKEFVRGQFIEYTITLIEKLVQPTPLSLSLTHSIQYLEFCLAFFFLLNFVQNLLDHILVSYIIIIVNGRRRRRRSNRRKKNIHITSRVNTMSTSTSTSTSSSSSPCRTAMNNLRMCLESFSQPQSMMPSSIRTSTSTNFGGLTQLENLFDTTFYKTIRLDLNGRSYRRDFLLYQARCNYIRRLRVENIVMEILDYETFHYTFDIILDNGDNDDQFTTTTTTTAPPKLIQFHSIATVNNKNGKIIKIKPMTGSAYVELFEYNINYVNDEQQHRQQQQQQQNNNKSLQSNTSSTISTKKATAIVTSEQQQQKHHPLLMNTQKKRRRQQQQQRKSSGIIRRVSGLFASHCRSKDFATTE